MKPHIRFDNHSRKWFALAHRCANRPVIIAHSFERLCEAMRMTHGKATLRAGLKLPRQQT
jgi:hypothetical protein